VAESRGNLDLAKEPLMPQRSGQVRSDHFDGDVAVMLQVAREVHCRHPAAAQLLPQSVSLGQQLRQHRA